MSACSRLRRAVGYEVAAAPAPLEGPPGGGLRFVVVTRLAGTELVRFKVDVSAADVVVGELESHLSDPILERLGFRRSRFPVYPIEQHVAKKLRALKLPRDAENTRVRDLVDLAWFIRHFLEPVCVGIAGLSWDSATREWTP